MIATLTAIMYIVSIADKTYNNKTVQKAPPYQESMQKPDISFTNLPPTRPKTI